MPALREGRLPPLSQSSSTVGIGVQPRDACRRFRDTSGTSPRCDLNPVLSARIRPFQWVMPDFSVKCNSRGDPNNPWRQLHGLIVRGGDGMSRRRSRMQAGATLAICCKSLPKAAFRWSLRPQKAARNCKILQFLTAKPDLSMPYWLIRRKKIARSH